MRSVEPSVYPAGVATLCHYGIQYAVCHLVVTCVGYVPIIRPIQLIIASTATRRHDENEEFNVKPTKQANKQINSYRATQAESTASVFSANTNK